MNPDDIVTLARRVVNEPWGVGNDELSVNPESWAPYYRFLHALVLTFKPRVAVELGVYMAVGTRHMAVANPETEVIGIDKDFHPAALDVVFKYNNITLITGDTVGSAPAVEKILNRLNAKIGLLFIDSEHDGTTPMMEYIAYKPYLECGCVVACDDILDPRMHKFWDWLPGYKMNLNFLHPNQAEDMPVPGFGISIQGCRILGLEL